MLTCNISENLKEALKIINENTKGCVFIVDDNECLVGVLTDGDIRRALINDFGLNSCVKEHMNKDFVYAKKNTPIEAISEMFNDIISIIPIVDDDMKFVDYIEFRTNQKVSLAEPQLMGNEYKYLNEALLSTWISSSGKFITRFESSFASFCGTGYGVATSNGTTALHLALLALGIGVGDEVIVPNMTFAATINAVLYTGATPVIVDIERDGWCIDPDEIEKHLTSKTKAIIPVHIYGQPCDMGRICNIAKKYNLYIVEDCAEAHGAMYDGKRVGSFGDIACFSFFGNKVITTGEGGMCLTNSPELDKKMRLFRDHGMSKERRYYHEVIGYNYRMTNMQAAVGLAQVERIEEILAWRMELENTYRAHLSVSKKVILQKNDLDKRTKIAWLVSVLVDAEKRGNIIDKLTSNGIDVRAFFVPLSQMDLYKEYVAGSCINSEDIAARGINLPTTYEVNEEIVDKIKEIIESV